MTTPLDALADDITDVHVMPVNDLIGHQGARDCWCKPMLTQEEGCHVVVVHHSMDGRELVEQHGVN